MAEIQAVLAALDVFSGAPDKASLDTANSWLQDFQHSSEAWKTCNVLLLSPEAPPAAKLFAAQTFRSKVIYDLHQLDPATLPSLRDSLLTALETHHAGPRTIITQLCLAIAALALQFPQWTDAVDSMIKMFGQRTETIPVLLQFIALLPEEMNNTRIPVTDAEWNERAPTLLRDNAKQITEILTLYLQSPVTTSAVQTQVFTCLRNWVAAEEIQPSDVASTPLFAYAFEALASEQLFDSAVDVICELIHETQEIDDNMSVIELIVARVISLKGELAKHKEDPDTIKGYARIFAEAGETYRMLILQHTEAFYPIVEAIGECSAHPDLDVVPVTFPFWTRLAQTINQKTSVPPPIVDAYRSLMQVIVQHLHYPPDSTPLVGQEADDFRSFRHTMGDTLKDCCIVLRTETCLLATHEVLVAALARGTSWQEVEAPLFALRSMGAELDVDDNVAVPKIMDTLPTLPDHPRVRYAALLIIARYTEWVDTHPTYVTFLLQYISAGFESKDPDVSGAAGQALRYLCRDCKQHLLEFLPTLHQFLKSTGSKLHPDDARQVYESIAYVISAMPMESAGAAFKNVAMDILGQVHAATNATALSKDDLKSLLHGVENLDLMLATIGSFGVQLPVACQNTCAESWTVFNEFIVKYGSDYEVAEYTTRVLRRGITFFGDAVLPIAPTVITRMSLAFESTGIPAYLWIAGKLVTLFGEDESPEMRRSFADVYERSTQKVVSILQERAVQTIPDVLQDYLHLTVPLIQFAPEVVFQSSAFPLVFKVAISSLSLVYADIIETSFDVILGVLNHDCLQPPPPISPPNYPAYASAINDVVGKEGLELVGQLLAGLVGDFPREVVSGVVSAIRIIATLWTSQFAQWVPLVLEQLPPTAVPMQAKREFLTQITKTLNAKDYDKVKYAVLDLHRTSSKARERRGTKAFEAT